MAPGTELSVRGLTGGYRFIKEVRTPTSVWIEVWGGRKNFEKIRMVDPANIRTVHWKSKMRGGS